MEAFVGNWKSEFSAIDGFEDWMNYYGADENAKATLRGKPWILTYNIDGDTYTIAFHPEGIPERNWPKMKFGETYDSYDVFGQPVKICMTYADGILTEKTDTPDGKSIVADRKIVNGKMDTKITGTDKSGKSAVLSLVMEKC